MVIKCIIKEIKLSFSFCMVLGSELHGSPETDSGKLTEKVRRRAGIQLHIWEQARCQTREDKKENKGRKINIPENYRK